MTVLLIYYFIIQIIWVFIFLVSLVIAAFYISISFCLQLVMNYCTVVFYLMSKTLFNKIKKE